MTAQLSYSFSYTHCTQASGADAGISYMGGQDACEICPVGGLWAAIDSLSEFSALALYTMPTKKEGERGPLDTPGSRWQSPSWLAEGPAGNNITFSALLSLVYKKSIISAFTHERLKRP